MQDAAGVAEAGSAFTSITVRINAGGLWCDVGAHAHQATGELVRDFAGLQV